MNLDDWPAFAPAAVLIVALTVSLISGRTINPIRGLQPMIVSRAQERQRYWSSIVLMTIFLGISGWMAWLGLYFSTEGRGKRRRSDFWPAAPVSALVCFTTKHTKGTKAGAARVHRGDRLRGPRQLFALLGALGVLGG